MVTRVFDQNVLNSYDRLKNFFQESDAIQQVLNQKDRVTLPEPKYGVPIARRLDSHLLPHLHGGWRVCQLVTAPFRWLTSIALRGIACFLKWIGATKCAKDFKWTAQCFEAGFAAPWRYVLGYGRVLQRTKNCPNDHGAVSHTPPLLKAQIQDPHVQKRVFERQVNNQKQVKFSGENGICRGMCEWFIYLYLKTKDQFADPRNHMVALAQQFAEGGGMDPTLLQQINLKNGKLLDMKIGMQEGRVRGRRGAAALDQTFFDWKDAPEKRIHELNHLPIGIYEIGLTFHAMVYIKINDQLGFLFDPNYGVIEVSGQEKGEFLYFFLLNRLGRILKEKTKDWSLLKSLPELSPEALEYLRQKPYREFLELVTSNQIPALNFEFTPYQLR